MIIEKVAVAGTLESSDLMVTIGPADCNGIAIDLQSTVEKQFGRQIRGVITETLRELEISAAKVAVIDKGALDCTVRARVTAAAYRACVRANYRWKTNETEGAR